MRRRLIIIALLLLVGAIVNVAIAWGCALRLPPEGQIILYSELDQLYVCINRHAGSTFAFTQEYNFYYSTGKCLDWDELRLELPWGSQFRHPNWIMREHQSIQSDLSIRAQAAEHSHGWPMLSMRCGYRAKFISPAAAEAELIGGIEIGEHNKRLIPFHVLWPGFAINTIFYAAILWVIFFTPGKMRRSIRRRRGLCPKCAYPIGTSDVCTECGNLLVSKRLTARECMGLPPPATPTTGNERTE